MNNNQLNEFVNNLPRNPGIIGKDEYFNSAVLIPLALIDNEYHFLFEKRAASIRQGGEICFPGGEYDEKTDKDFLETAIRETEEELGLDRKQIKILGSMHTFLGPMGVTVDSFVALFDIKKIEDLDIDKNEVEKVFTVPVSFFEKNQPDEYKIRLEMHSHYVNDKGEKIDLFPVEQIGLPAKYSKPRSGKSHKVYVYKTKPDIIWGITAALIREVIGKINSEL
ncbi:MAG TPA: CoA pyrophosphatase [Ignavibacteriaceae bacterium]|nr:CoA pyrophosphatase [Ignavibacteriaceae bacterium]